MDPSGGPKTLPLQGGITSRQMMGGSLCVKKGSRIFREETVSDVVKSDNTSITADRIRRRIILHGLVPFLVTKMARTCLFSLPLRRPVCSNCQQTDREVRSILITPRTIRRLFLLGFLKARHRRQKLLPPQTPSLSERRETTNMDLVELRNAILVASERKLYLHFCISTNGVSVTMVGNLTRLVNSVYRRTLPLSAGKK